MYMNPVLTAAAVIPAIILLVKVYRADRLEKEPVALIVSLVGFGIMATLVALVCEQLGERILTSFFPEGSMGYNIIMYFGIVSFSEEGAKYLLLKRRTWYSPEFNCQFDGVVYGVSVSLGFALWENLGYTAMYGMSTALLRAVTAVPGHACFGVFMGVWYGMAKRWQESGVEGRSRLCRVFALVIPALIHGCYDFIATYDSRGLSWIFVGFISVLFAVSMLLVRKMSAGDRYISGRRFYF